MVGSAINRSGKRSWKLTSTLPLQSWRCAWDANLLHLLPSTHGGRRRRRYKSWRSWEMLTLIRGTLIPIGSTPWNAWQQSTGYLSTRDALSQQEFAAN